MRSTLLIAGLAALALGATLTAADLTITSTAFAPNGSIPSKYTCEGENINPPLAFANVPANTKSLALVVDDPDVPKNLMPSGVFDHWLIWDLPASATGIAEGKGTGGINGRGKPGWTGPCPPDREHRYFFKLYALDKTLAGVTIANKKDLEQAMEGHVLAHAELIGRYDKMKK